MTVHDRVRLRLSLAAAAIGLLIGACGDRMLPTAIEEAEPIASAPAAPTPSLTIADLTCSTSWSAAVDGDWHDAANWSLGVPDADADACITAEGSYTVRVDAAAAARTLGLGHTGGSSAIRLRIDAPLAVGAGGAMVLSDGILDWLGSDIHVDGELRNEGLWVVAFAEPIPAATPRLQGAGSIVNDGVVRRDGLQSVDIRVPLTGGGALEAVSGALTLRQGGSFSGSASFAAFDGGAQPGRIDFNDVGAPGALYSFADGITFGGAGGEFRSSSQSTIQLEGSLTVAPGAWFRPGAGGAGLVSGIGPLLVDGRLDPGVMDADVIVRSGGLMRLSSINLDRIQFAAGTTVTNQPGGTILWDRGQFRTDGTIHNLGLFAVDGAGPDFATLTGAGALRNDGVVRRDGTGSVDVHLPVMGGGALEAVSGVLIFRRGGSFSASARFAAYDGGDQRGRIDFNDGGAPGATYVFADGLVLGGDGGEFRSSAQSTVQLEGSLTVGTGVSLETGAGVGRPVTGVGPLLVDGRLEPGWMEVDVTVRSGGLMLLSNPNDGRIRFASGTTVTNDPGGTILWGRSSVDLDGVVENRGAFTVAAVPEGLFLPSTIRGDGRIDNHGMFRTERTDPDHTPVVVEVAFVNHAGGVVSAEAGTLAFGAAFENRTAGVLQGTATLGFGAAELVNSGTTAPGLSPGLLTIESDFAIPAAAMLEIEAAGAGAGQHDRLAVAGDAELGGTLVVRLLDGFVPADGQQFVVITAGAVHGTFGEVHAPTGFAATVIAEPARVLLELRADDGGTPPGGYDFTGFRGPVRNPPEWNHVNAGRVVPIRFGLGGFHGLDIFAPGSPGSRAAECGGSGGLGATEPIVSPGRSGLTYDAAADEYQVNWATEPGWRATCRELVLELDDGSVHTALFEFR